MNRVAPILVLILVLAAGSLAAQETFDLPVELELPDLPLALELDNATLDVLLEPGSSSVLRARGSAAEGSLEAALVLASEGGRILVRRGDGEEPKPRLGLELVLDPERRLSVTGSELDVAVQAVRIEAAPERDDDGSDEDDDESDSDESDESDPSDPSDEDEDDDDDEGDDDDEDGGEDEEAARHVAGSRSLAFDVEASSIQLAGVQSASVRAVDGYLHATGTEGDLEVTLEGGVAEILEHRGALVLTGHGGELVVSDFQGRSETTLVGGSLLARSGVGQLESRLDGALLRLEGWRGRLQAEGRDSRIEARALQGVRLDLQGEALDVTVEEHQGQLRATLRGGRFSASDLKGQTVINGHDGAEVALDRLAGNLTLAMQGGSTRLVDLRGQIHASVYDGRLEIDGAQQLDLVTQRAEVVAGRLERLGKAQIADSQVDLDLSAVLHNPTLALRGSSEVRVRLRAPCSVKLGEAQLLNSQADVIGCELHSQTLRRTRYDSRGLDGRRRVLLRATLGTDSRLEVEGVP